LNSIQAKVIKSNVLICAKMYEWQIEDNPMIDINDGLNLNDLFSTNSSTIPLLMFRVLDVSGINIFS